MKSLSKIPKILPVVIIFIFLHLVSGCYTSKIISNSELPEYSKPFIQVQTIDTAYWLYNTRIENDTLIGIIGKYEGQHKTFYIKVYLRSDSLLEINPEKTMMRIPFMLIDKVEVQKFSVSVPAALILGFGLGIALTLWIIVAGI